MTDIGQLETGKITENHKGPYVRAVFSPSEPQFKDMLSQTSRSILEIGCGAETPRISWKLGPKELWIGCDPGLGNNNLVYKGSRPMHSLSQMALFPSQVADIPKFQPNVFLAVAPNQEDIVDGKIFNSELEQFLDANPKKTQYFFIALDTRTHEAHGYQDEAIATIRDWMRVNKFIDTQRQLVDDSRLEALKDRFHPNSNDLGEKVKAMCFVRNL
jgi:hypothetical protein